MNTVQQMKENGVVGAGGAGFPTYVKAQSQAEIVLVNAAECEPLLHKDKQLLLHATDLFFQGLQTLMGQVAASKGIIGIKKKHKGLIAHLNERLPAGIELCPVDDFYPAGDELTLIRETTGVIIGPGALPISRGIVVSNVESLYNIGTARPVTAKFLNVGGAVEKRQTFEVPLGISFQEIIDYACPTIRDFTIIEGGPMMGKIVEDLTQPVTKTTAGLLVFPNDHVLIQKYRIMASEKRVNQIGKAACDQCTICTELCPRYLLGHPIQPHKAMRSLVFHQEGAGEREIQTHALYCCQCNLCSFVSCPEGLFPSQVCINNRAEALANKMQYKGTFENEPHPLAPYRKTPSKRLKRMLNLDLFPDSGDLSEYRFAPQTLRLLLRQHIGAPATPVVSVGDQVQQGQKIATVGDALGAEIHAPLSGQVCEVDEQAITLTCPQNH
nr:4Fe-4S dicluster domain-containing protein [uncultured Desulfobulbus sp.]